MKKVAICAALFFTCIGAHAECDDFDELAKIDGVEFEHVDKSMIDLAAKQGKTVTVGDNLVLGGDGEGEDFFKKFDDLRVFKCEENGNIKKFKKIVLKLLKNKDFEPLIDTNGEDGEIFVDEDDVVIEYDEINSSVLVNSEYLTDTEFTSEL